MNRLDPDGRCAKGFVQGNTFGSLPDNPSLAYQIGYGVGAVNAAYSLLSGGDSNNTNSAISLTTPDLRPSGYSDGFGDHYSFCYSCHDPNDPGARLQFQMAQNATVGIRAYTQVAFIAATAGLGEFSALEETAAKTVGSAETLALPTIRQAEGGLVIGRGADLSRPFALAENEYRLSWPATSTAQSEWKINSGLLRQEMGKGLPIRDISPGNNGGMYLNAERNLLDSRGWTYDAATGYWHPPGT